MSRGALNLFAFGVICLGAVSTAEAQEEQASSICTPEKYFHCYMDDCVAYQPCNTLDPNAYTGCASPPEEAGWYSRTAFNNFQCGA